MPNFDFLEKGQELVSVSPPPFVHNSFTKNISYDIYKLINWDSLHVRLNSH